MKWMRVCFTVLCLWVVLVAGCKPDNAATGVSSKQGGSAQGVFAEFTDFAGRKITLQKKPERVAVLVPSILNYVDTVGGTIIGRPSARAGEVPASMRKAEEVGQVYNISMEKVVGLKPDLVLLNSQLHEKFIKLLDANHIQSVVLQPKTFEETKRALLLTGKIYGREQAAVAKNQAMDEAVKKVISQIPKEAKKIVILHATPSTVTVELENSIAGSTAKLLGFTNIAAGNKALEGRPERTPYSMEVLVEKDPDIIFITSMGAKEKIESRLQADVKGNPAYASLRAVQSNKVYVLPEDLFLLTPGLRFPEAVQLMAKDVYPEVFK